MMNLKELATRLSRIGDEDEILEILKENFMIESSGFRFIAQAMQGVEYPCIFISECNENGMQGDIISMVEVDTCPAVPVLQTVAYTNLTEDDDFKKKIEFDYAKITEDKVFKIGTKVKSVNFDSNIVWVVKEVDGESVDGAYSNTLNYILETEDGTDCTCEHFSAIQEL